MNYSTKCHCNLSDVIHYIFKVLVRGLNKISRQLNLGDSSKFANAILTLNPWKLPYPYPVVTLYLSIFTLNIR